MIKNQGGKKMFSTGDLVTVKNMSTDAKFCIISIQYDGEKEPIARLKALFNNTYIIEKPLSELNSLLIKGLL